MVGANIQAWQAEAPALSIQAYRPVLSKAGRNACRYLCAFMRDVPEGGECGKDRYILRNKANKSFRINKSSSKEVQKAIKRRTEVSKREVI